MYGSDHCITRVARQIIEDAAVHEQYSRVITPEPAINEETEDVCALIQQCLDLRRASPGPVIDLLRPVILVQARMLQDMLYAFHSPEKDFLD